MCRKKMNYNYDDENIYWTSQEGDIEMNKSVDISNVILKTERLTLRPWTLYDVDDLYEYAKEDGVGIWAGWMPHKDKEESKHIVESFIKHKKVLAIEYEGRVIGSLGIECYKESEYPELKNLKARELGYVLAKEHWGKGLMTEAVTEVIRYLFEDELLDAITCCCYLQNDRSARVQEKCGFEFVRNSVHETSFGEKRDVKCNILTREKYVGVALVSPCMEYAEELWGFRQEVLEHDADDANQFAGCMGLRESKTPEEWIELCEKRQLEDWGKEDTMKVPSHSYLAVRVADHRIVGIIDLRHHINHPILGTWGGHCGYTVRPSERGQGYAKEMLRQNLINARKIGITNFLITCHPWNAASEKTILANGGIFENAVDAGGGEIFNRYWIITQV